VFSFICSIPHFLFFLVSAVAAGNSILKLRFISIPHMYVAGIPDGTDTVISNTQQYKYNELTGETNGDDFILSTWDYFICHRHCTNRLFLSRISTLIPQIVKVFYISFSIKIIQNRSESGSLHAAFCPSARSSL
jgi:hypothetical protein